MDWTVFYHWLYLLPLLIAAAMAAALAYFFGRRHRVLGAKALMAAAFNREGAHSDAVGT